MPTYSTIYVAIPRIGSGRDADNALRPDFIGRDGRWPRASKVTSVFGGHPTHVIARVMSEPDVLRDLRDKSGVMYLGDTIEQARVFLGSNVATLASRARAATQAQYDKNPARYSRLGPSPLFLIDEPVPSPTTWTDAEVRAMIVARPAGYPVRSWLNRVRSHFAMPHTDVQRLLGGRTQIWSAGFGGSQSNWSDSGATWSFDLESGTITRTQGSGAGRVTWASDNAVEIAYVGGATDTEDAEVHAVYDVNTGATRVGAVARMVAANSDYLFIQLKDPSSAGADAQAFSVDNGVFVEEDVASNIGPINPGELRGRFEDNGSNTRIRGRFWSGAEPGTWDLDATTTVLDEQTGDSGLRSHLQISTGRFIDWDSAEADDLVVGNGADVRSHIVPAYYRVNA